MILKFIGANGSMGLEHNRNYNVSIKTEGVYIWVTWIDKYGEKMRCPYSSPQSFANNWSR